VREAGFAHQHAKLWHPGLSSLGQSTAVRLVGQWRRPVWFRRNGASERPHI
jgi:hypothetical protein